MFRTREQAREEAFERAVEARAAELTAEESIEPAACRARAEQAIGFEWRDADEYCREQAITKGLV